MVAPPTKLSVTDAVSALRKGRLVILPTETVYGLGAAALDPAAVARIFSAKGRPRFNPIICHLASAAQLADFAVLPRYLPLQFWPGPLTVLLPHGGRIPSIVTGGSPLCAFRIPDHPLMLEVLEQFENPVAAPSANRSGRVSPTTAQLAYEQVGASVEGFLDGGPCRLGVESTVVLPLDDGRSLRILRQGGVTEEQLEAVGFRIVREGPPGGEAQQGMSVPVAVSPGTQLRHYATEKPLIFVRTESRFLNAPEALIETALHSGLRAPLFLCFGEPVPAACARHRHFNLSPSGDLIEAAARLFSLLAEADTGSADGVLAFSVPEHDLGRAINDRLLRAAVRVADHTETGWVFQERTEGTP